MGGGDLSQTPMISLPREISNRDWAIVYARFKGFAQHCVYKIRSRDVGGARVAVNIAYVDDQPTQ